ncbi:MAG: 30S ribosomal protein S20 [Coprococcus sp.]
MANIKSARRESLLIRQRLLRNKMIKSGVKTAVKKVDAAIAAGDKEAAKCFIKRNKHHRQGNIQRCLPQEHFSSRKIGRMTVAVNKMN